MISDANDVTMMKISTGLIHFIVLDGRYSVRANDILEKADAMLCTTQLVYHTSRNLAICGGVGILGYSDRPSGTMVVVRDTCEVNKIFGGPFSPRFISWSFFFFFFFFSFYFSLWKVGEGEEEQDAKIQKEHADTDTDTYTPWLLLGTSHPPRDLAILSTTTWKRCGQRRTQKMPTTATTPPPVSSSLPCAGQTPGPPS